MRHPYIGLAGNIFLKQDIRTNITKPLEETPLEANKYINTLIESVYFQSVTVGHLIET